MPKTSFYVTMQAPEGFAADQYATQAGIMANAFTGVFGDVEKLATITKNAAMSGAHTEIDVGQPDGKLAGRAVVEFESDDRVVLDKTKLSAQLRALVPWKNCKIEKRAVEPELPA